MMLEFDFELLLEAWRAFIQRGQVLPEVAPYVASSWQRCRSRLDPHRHAQLKRLSPEHLLSAQVASFELISLARPVIEDTYQFIEGSDTVVLITNAAGYVLDWIGDAEMMQILEGLGIVPGALLSEMEMGSNAFALAIHERSVVRVAGAEHYLENFHDLADTAAPIFDLSGRPMGTIGIMNLFFRHHPHSLGMVVAAARAIEGQRQADFLLAEQNSQMAQLNAIVEASSDGMLVLDNQGLIMHMNQSITAITGLTKQAALGRKIDDLIEFPGFINEAVSRRDLITDVEVGLRIGDRAINCIVSLKYVINDGRIRWLIATLRQEKDVRELVQQQVGAQAPLKLEDIPGDSPAIRRVQRIAKVAAAAQASILIRGESGTGKNVLASAIHNASPRREGPFLIIGCTSIPHEWVVSELLGFAESVDRKNPGGRPSKFELAKNGTLFFQNVDDLPLEAQSILLNVLDLGIIQRLGSDRPIQLDVRIIASTSENIEKLIAQGNFRADLYYRLSAFEITLPPLRDRMEDLPVLAERILVRLSRQLGRTLTVESGVMELLVAYSWPGNVRELEAVLSRAAIQASPSGPIGVINLPVEIQESQAFNSRDDTQEIQPLYQLERNSILQAARVCKGNLSEMARLLGIGRTTVWRRVKEMNLALDEYRYHQGE